MRFVAVAMMGALAVAAARAQGVLGIWQTPAGGVVSVYACGERVCAKVLQVNRNTLNKTDEKNPRAELRSRPLCGLEVGRGFTLGDEDHAENGELYEPASGRTYRGSMASEGGSLKLRGYVGVKLFGRTETWMRIGQAPASCGR